VKIYYKLKRLIIFYAILITSVAFLADIGEAAKLKLRVKVATANIRLKPTMKAIVILHAPLGAILDSEEKTGNWYKVNLPPDESGVVVSGYIHQNVVEVIEEIKKVPKEEKPPEKEIKEKPEKKEIRVQQPPQVPIEKADKIQKKAKPPSVKKKIYQVKVGINYFIPSEKVFKDIYGGGMMYMGEINIAIWKSLELWIGGSYFLKKGKLTFTEEETKLEIIPIGGGLRFRLSTGRLDFYVGGGLSYFLSEEKNPIGDVSKRELGYDGRIGSIVELPKGLIIDIFINYSYSITKPADFKVNIGGFRTGIGIGYKF